MFLVLYPFINKCSTGHAGISVFLKKLNGGFRKPCKLGEESMLAQMSIHFWWFNHADKDAHPILEGDMCTLTRRDAYPYQSRCALVYQKLFFTVYK